MGLGFRVPVASIHKLRTLCESISIYIYLYLYLYPIYIYIYIYRYIEPEIEVSAVQSVLRCPRPPRPSKQRADAFSGRPGLTDVRGFGV